MFKCVLITGSSGVIGSCLVDIIRKLSKKIIAFDKREPGIGCENWINDENVEIIIGNVLDEEKIQYYISLADVVIHLAAPMSILQFEHNPSFCIKETIDGFVNVIESIRKHNIRKFVTASTGAVYEGLDFSEMPYIENANVAPPDLKAYSKRATEEIAFRYKLRYGVNTIIIRPQSVYSPFEASKGIIANIISLFTWSMVAGKQPIVWNDGNQTRDFVFVEDAARAFINACYLDGVTDIFNLCSGVETSFNQVISIINKLLCKSIEPLYIKAPLQIYSSRFLGSPAKAIEQLDFQCQIPLEAGIRKVITETMYQAKDIEKLSCYNTEFDLLLN